MAGNPGSLDLPFSFMNRVQPYCLWLSLARLDGYYSAARAARHRPLVITLSINKPRWGASRALFCVVVKAVLLRVTSRTLVMVVRLSAHAPLRPANAPSPHPCPSRCQCRDAHSLGAGRAGCTTHPLLDCSCSSPALAEKRGPQPAVAMHAEGLVVLAAIRMAAAARETLLAVDVQRGSGSQAAIREQPIRRAC